MKKLFTKTLLKYFSESNIFNGVFYFASINILPNKRVWVKEESLESNVIQVSVKYSESIAT